MRKILMMWTKTCKKRAAYSIVWEEGGFSEKEIFALCVDKKIRNCTVCMSFNPPKCVKVLITVNVLLNVCV